MNKKLSKVVFIILLVILVPILLFNIIIMFKSIINKDEIPGVLGYKPMIVLTGSMEPTIMEGDLVIVKDSNRDPVDNDIISYRDKENLVITHRVVEIEQIDGRIAYTTKGDNNNANDVDKVYKEQIEGIYSFKISKLGGILEYIQTPTGIVIISLSILLIVFVLVSLGKNMDEKELNKEFEEFKKQKKLEKNK